METDRERVKEGRDRDREKEREMKERDVQREGETDWDGYKANGGMSLLP